MAANGGKKELDALLKQPSEWLRGSGPVSDLVISSRIRLARNFEKFSFATRATKEGQAEVLKLATEGIKQAPTIRKPLLLEMGELDEVDRQFLVERHLVSREHIVHPEAKGVAVGENEVVSVMVTTKRTTCGCR
jgi:protein arginine kinase